MLSDQNHQPKTSAYAPPKRCSDAEVVKQRGLAESIENLQWLLDALPVLTLVLNRERQILLANRALFEKLGVSSVDDILGLRPGELLQCLHAHSAPSGCGTAEACRACGAVNAVLDSQKTKNRATRDCQLLVKHDKQICALDFRITATPADIAGNEEFTIVSILDIGDERRRRALERIFFHDVLNSAGGIRGLLDLALEEESDEERENILLQLANAADLLLSQVSEQLDLLRAEGSELIVKPREVSSSDLLTDAADTIRAHASGREMRISVSSDSRDVSFVSDRTLLQRVLLNMLKNACEASPAGSHITCGSRMHGDCVELWVNNPGVIEKETRLKIFKRSFSTKGSGRGLGTYSIKLLTETYLKGVAGFYTSEETGTTFFVRCPKDLQETANSD